MDEKIPKSKTFLTDPEVVELRKLYATRKYTMKELGDLKGLSVAGVSRIVTGKRRLEAGGPIVRQTFVISDTRDGKLA